MAYSLDLRIRAVEAYEQKSGTREQVSKLFQIGVATLNRWIHRYRHSGTAERLPCSGGKNPRIGTIGEIILLDILDGRPDATLREIAGKYGIVTRMLLSKSVIHDTLERLGITRKKKQFSTMNKKLNGFKNYERTLPMT